MQRSDSMFIGRKQKLQFLNDRYTRQKPKSRTLSGLFVYFRCYIKSYHQFSDAVICFIQSFGLIAAFCKDITCFEEIIKLKFKIVAHCLHSCKLHFNGYTTLVLTPGDKSLCLTQHRIRSPHPALYIWDTTLFKQVCKLVTVLYLYVIVRRCILCFLFSVNTSCIHHHNRI